MTRSLAFRTLMLISGFALLVPVSFELAWANPHPHPQTRVYSPPAKRNTLRLAQAPLSGQVYTVAPSTPQAILDRLTTANQVPADVVPTIAIEKNSTLNAATNGRAIMITDSLYNKLQTNDEKAFVISHELAHVMLSHITKTQVRRTGFSILDALLARKFGANSPVALASQFGINLLELKSERGYEYQADDLGVNLMVKAGYNPQAAISVFKILEANAPSSGLPGFLMSHPLTEQRIQYLVKKYQLSLQ